MSATPDLLYPRIGTPRDESFPTFGGQVGEIARALGFPLYRWQQHIVDVALEYEMKPVYDDQGVLIEHRPKLRYREVRLWVPRQSGKTILMMAILAWRCLMGPELFGVARSNVKFFSTTGMHAKQKWEDEHVPYLENSLLNGQFRVRRNNGHEAVIWNNDSIWSLGASTEKAGHGDSLDLVVADEFFAQADDRIEEGARPTMITRPSPQIWFVSTFGSVDPDKESKSDPLWRKVDDGRERARNGDFGSVAVFEYSAADFDDFENPIDYGDQLMWRRTMPGLAENGGSPNYTLDAVQDEFDSMQLIAFKRAYLNLRPPRGVRKVPALIKPQEWDAVCDERSERRRSQVLCLGVDVEPDNLRASIVGAGPGRLRDVHPDEQPKFTHVELIKDEEGSAWVADEIARLLLRHDVHSVAVDAGGPAIRLVPDLEKVCERARVQLIKYNGKRWQGACEAFRVAVVDATMRNHGQPTLAAAVDQGVRRDVGDLWVWDRKTAIGCTSPLVAATAAHMAVQEATAAGGRRTSAYEDEDAQVWH